MQTKLQWWKLVVGFILFLFFHQISDLVGGGTLGAILGEGIESIYSHMKMYFYAYLVVSVIDYFLHRSKIFSAGSFWDVRMLIASSFPWMSIAIWFIPIALRFELGKYELAYSIVMTFFGFYFATRLDEGLDGLQFRPALKALIRLAFIASFITYIGFSFHAPNNFFSASR